MTLTWNILGEIVAILGVVLPIISRWTSGIKKTQSAMFSKHDELNKDLQEYKLLVATTYVNKEALREALEPIKDTLKEIRQDLHREHQ